LIVKDCDLRPRIVYHHQIVQSVPVDVGRAQIRDEIIDGKRFRPAEPEDICLIFAMLALHPLPQASITIARVNPRILNPRNLPLNPAASHEKIPGMEFQL